MSFKLHIIAALLLAVSSSSVFAAQDKIEYLALGDSVAFGYDPTVLVPIESNFIGYPEIVAERAKKQFSGLMSLACPGQTSGSFLLTTAAEPLKGCRVFRSVAPLHTAYSGSQADYAVELLNSKPSIKLVTIGIGGNDLLLLQETCHNDPVCIFGGLPATLAAYRANLITIFRRIREQARYHGRMVLVTYYSPDYRDPIQTGGIAALNAVALQVATLFGAKIADGFSAFMIASIPNGGDSCAAQLLVPGGPPCDVHPSPKGRDLLADAVLRLLPGTK